MLQQVFRYYNRLHVVIVMWLKRGYVQGQFLSKRALGQTANSIRHFSMRSATCILLSALIAAGITHAYGMNAVGVFKKVSPSVFVVVSKDASGQVKAQGSGVQISKGRVITNCHVVNEANSIVLIQQDKRTTATIRNRDKERDLCLLVAGQPLDGPAVVLSASSKLEQGQPVYAIGAPLGLELTISDGVVSGLRKAAGGFIVQTSAAISPGSSGGGLFDAEGRLVGITTFQYVKGQNLNFAVPAEWISQVEVREAMEVDLRERRDVYEKAVGAYDLNDPAHQQKIVQLSQKYLQSDPDYILALFNLAYALQKSGQSSTAEPIWVRLVDLPSKGHLDSVSIGMGALFLSTHYEETGRTAQARDAAANAVINLPIQITLGHYWSFMAVPEDYKEAIQVFKTAVTVAPSSPEAWAYLGGSYMNTKDYDNSIPAFRRATQLKPDYEWAWFGYILTLRKSGANAEMEKAVGFLYQNQRDMLNRILKSFKAK